MTIHYDYPIAPLTVRGGSPFRMHTAEAVGIEPPDGFRAYFQTQLEMKVFVPWRNERGETVLGRSYPATWGRN